MATKRFRRQTLKTRNPRRLCVPETWTLGYAGRSPEDFLKILKDYGIERVVDIRELPLTEVPGFSQGPLSAFLAKNGVAYDLRRELGAPQNARDRFKEDGDYEAFCETYLIALPRKAVEALAHTCSGQRCLILSEDRSPDRSLRRPLGARLERHGFRVKHIL